MGRFDQLGDAVRSLVKSAGGPLSLWPPTDEQLMAMVHAMEARKPKQTMDRFAGVLAARGVRSAGEWGDVRKSLAGMPSSATGPGGLSAGDWVDVLRDMPDAPDYTATYVTDPVRSVASQYPEHLREQAMDVARRFQVPIGNGASVLFQRALADKDLRAVIMAYPRRSAVGKGYSGMAVRGATPRAPGLAEVAAGRGISERNFDGILLHELRHTLEGDGIDAKWRHPAWGEWTMPRRMYDESADAFYRYGPGNKEYLSRLQEEAARFADARARYAQESGRLIETADEADEVARAALAGERGLGDGFNDAERAFYRAARETSPALRAHQNKLLQGLLSVPAVIGASLDGTED